MLPTRVWAHRLFPHTIPMCRHCLSDFETPDHLLWHCPKVERGEWVEFWSFVSGAREAEDNFFEQVSVVLNSQSKHVNLVENALLRFVKKNDLFRVTD